jgi:hypothetical protein
VRTRCLLWTVAVVAGILLIAEALPSPVLAGPEPPTALATAYNTQRKLARSPDGTLYAAVTVNASGVPQVRVLSTTDGSGWTALPHPSVSGNASDRASLAIDSARTLHLVWTETTRSDRQVFYARFTGGRWSPVEQLSHSTGYAGFPSLAVDARDRVHVVWYGFDGAFYQIYYRRLEPVGWNLERALTNTAADATNPAIGLGPEGNVHIAWFRLDRNRTLDEVAYLRLEGDTVAETRTLSAPGVDAIDPTLAVDAAGTVHVVWSGLVGGADRLQHVERGSAWSAVETIAPGMPGARHPSTALDARSRLHVVWEGPDGQVYLQVRDGSWSPPLALSSAGSNRYPSARWSQDDNPLCGPNGRIDVVWTSEAFGSSSLAYRAIDVSAACSGPPDWTVSIAIAAGILIVAISGLVAVAARGRRRGE